MTNALQLSLFEPETRINSDIKESESTFVDNMSQPVHRWFRFSAGYSGEWVERLLTRYERSSDFIVLDPFCGSGTTLIASDKTGVHSIGIEAHPFVYKIAQAKTEWRSNISQFIHFIDHLILESSNANPDLSDYPTLIRACFPDSYLSELDKLRQAWRKIEDNTPASRLAWLGITAILRSCSPVGTSNMELIQPKKTKKNPNDPPTAFRKMADVMINDMRLMHRDINETRSQVYLDDARELNSISDSAIDLVISSPPYVNNFDYADAVRFEMSFWGEVSSWGDLQSCVRRHLIVSCSQHASANKISVDELLANSHVKSIIDELKPVVDELGDVRLNKGGKKHYHSMVAAYFIDMSQAFIALRRVCKAGSEICLVIGDSAPYGVYVPVHQWLGELAISAGFDTYAFEKTRDRNLKWKNRKHRVPLQEGRLWIKG